jgi:hypothetical protein
LTFCISIICWMWQTVSPFRFSNYNFFCMNIFIFCENWKIKQKNFLINWYPQMSELFHCKRLVLIKWIIFNLKQLCGLHEKWVSTGCLHNALQWEFLMRMAFTMARESKGFLIFKSLETFQYSSFVCNSSTLLNSLSFASTSGFFN